MVIYCQTTGASAAHATHCATYCTPCRPLIRAFSGWIRTPPPTEQGNLTAAQTLFSSLRGRGERGEVFAQPPAGGQLPSSFQFLTPSSEAGVAIALQPSVIANPSLRNFSLLSGIALSDSSLRCSSLRVAPHPRTSPSMAAATNETYSPRSHPGNNPFQIIWATNCDKQNDHNSFVW